MGIKTKFNPMGGRSDFDKGKLSDWRYSTASNGQITLYEYLGTYSSTKPVYVPVKKGKTVINNYTSGTTTTASNTPFYNNPNVISVDLQNVPFVSNNMASAFRNCRYLTSVNNINPNVTYMYETFYDCHNLNQNIQIPNSVTNMSYTFSGCTSLNQNIQIPNSVTNMYRTFAFTTGLSGKNITIHPAGVLDAGHCFNSSNVSKNVILSSRYINNTFTTTRNTLISNSYAVGTCVGNSVSAGQGYGAVFYAYDPVSWEGYNTWTGDGTHWTLSKWAGIGKAAGTTDVVVPQEITSYAKFPTMINRACFSKNAVITSIDLGTNIPWVGNAVGTGTNGKNRNAVCLNCFNIKSAYGTIRNDVTDISAAFDRCYNLTDIRVVWPDSVTKAYVTYEMTNITDAPPFGEGITNMQSCFYSANSLINYPVVPPKVTVLTSTFAAGCSNSARGNIFILANALTGNAKVAGAYFSGYNTSYRRNIYTYFNFSNGTATTTRARFASNAIYKGTSGNAAGTDPMYNSTSNFYVYNLCSRFSQIWTESSGTTSTTLLKYNTAQAIPHIAVFAQYPDYNVVSIGNNCFQGATNLKSVALYNRPFNSTNLDSAFAGCFNLFVIQGLNLSGANSMMGTFGSCYNLNQNISIPNTVINTGHIFWNCSNLNQDILIGYGTQNVAEAFHACTNFNRSVNILSTAVTNALNIFADTSASKTVYIPFKYSSSSGSAYTTTFNSFVSAGYLYSNGMSTNKHGVMVKDSHYVFWDLACVLYNTSILMSDGTYKEIKDVNVGDILKTYNEDTKDYEDNQVLYVSKNSKDDIIKVTFEDDSYIELTTGHPFLTEKGWASYDNEKTRKENLYNRATLYQLEIGDKCLTQDGSYLQITNIEREDLGSVDVYDFTIENAHTFIAGGSSSQNHHFVLHNAET